MTDIITTVHSVRKNLLVKFRSLQCMHLASLGRSHIFGGQDIAYASCLTLRAAGHVANLTQTWTWGSSRMPPHAFLLLNFLTNPTRCSGPQYSFHSIFHFSIGIVLTVLNQLTIWIIISWINISLIRPQVLWMQKSLFAATISET
jgi:hypothetical protein